jgi:hypothetical protein
VFTIRAPAAWFVNQRTVGREQVSLDVAAVQGFARSV